MLLILLIVFFCAGYVFVSVFAKSIIKDRIQKELNLKIELASACLGLPLNLEIKALTVENFAKIEKIKISPSILGLVSGRIILNEVTLINPEITLEREKSGTFNIPQIPRQQGKNRVIIAGLTIKDGLILFFDRKTTETFSFAIKNIEVKIYKAKPLPYPLTIKYALSAFIPSRPGIKEASVRGKGWVDITNRDMQGNLNISDIDAFFFKPYLGKFIPSTIRLDSARADFKADLFAENNDLVIKCRLAMKELLMEKQKQSPQAQEEESLSESLTALALNLSKNSRGENVLEFRINTKLDKPRLNNITFLKSKVFQNVIENVIENPQKATDSIQQITEHLKKDGKELKQELKKTLKSLKIHF